MSSDETTDRDTYRLHVHITPEIYYAIHQVAYENKTNRRSPSTVSEVVRDALQHYLEMGIGS